MNEKKHTITLSNGQTYDIQPVSETFMQLAKEGARRKLEKEGVRLAPPTYEIEIAGGAKQAIPHDETTLETDADRRAWAEYQAGLQKLQAAQNDAQMRVWLTALQFKLPEDTRWIERQKWFGVEIPEGEFDLTYHYLTTELLKTADDMLKVIEEVTRISYTGVVKEEDLEALVGSFRGYLQGKTPKRAADPARELEPQSPADGAGDGKSLGTEA